MLFSLALLLLLGMVLGGLFERLHLPPLLGMLLGGMLLGPAVLGLLSPSLLAVSADLRRIALLVILTRAGLSLRLEDLRRVGRPAFLMCFVPATCELLAVVLLAPALLGITALEAAVLGAVLAAVSPAVVVPRMLALMEEGRGVKEGIPQLILAGASVDDIFVIVLFSAFTELAAGDGFSPLELLRIPSSILLGIFGGILCGWLLLKLFDRFSIAPNRQVAVLLALSFILVTVEDACTGAIGFSGLLAVMCVGILLQRGDQLLVTGLSTRYSAIWSVAELLLFGLVGASVDVRYAAGAGLPALGLIFGALLLRMLGVALCLLHTPMTAKQRLFCMLAYTPKATVQAAIGGIPLAMGLPCGELVLTIAVLSILITAPLGAVAIQIGSRRLLEPSKV